MKSIITKPFVSFILLIIFFNCSAGEPDSEKILKEGKLLCKLEKASMYATDDLYMRFSHLLNTVGGYLSYESSDNIFTTIFFRIYDENEILVRYRFDSLLRPVPVVIDTINKEATIFERELILIRQDAVKRLFDENDTFFTHYESLLFNPIPIINAYERKVYIMPYTEEQIILLGNDYLLYYNNFNEFIERKKLHKDLIVFTPEIVENGKKLTETRQIQELYDFIQPTDICTLLLYKQYLKWYKHLVFSQNYVSIFDMRKETLKIITREEWEKENANE